MTPPTGRVASRVRTVHGAGFAAIGLAFGVWAGGGLHAACALFGVAFVLGIAGLRDDSESVAWLTSALGCVGLLATGSIVALLFVIGVARDAGSSIRPGAVRFLALSGHLDNYAALRHADAIVDEVRRLDPAFAPPVDAAGQAAVESLSDVLGRSLRYRNTPRGYEIRSAAFDGEFDTGDDWVITRK